MRLFEKQKASGPWRKSLNWILDAQKAFDGVTIPTDVGPN